MNDELRDFDDDIATAFEPLRSTPTPDLWDRIETTSQQSAPDERQGSPRRLFAMAAAVLLAVAGFAAIQTLRSDTPVDVIDLVPTTTTPATSIPATTTPAPTTPAPTAEPSPLFEGANWVRLDLQTNELVSNTGETYPVENVQFGSGLAMDRLPDGTVVVATEDGVLSFAPGAVEPELIFTDPARGLRRNGAGELEILTDDGPINPETGESADAFFVDDGQAFSSANGFAVEVIPGDFESLVPDDLRLLQDGEQSTIWRFGGPDESVVVLDDFNGRFILAHRGPQEPALPPSQHVVIDLFTGNVDSFTAIPGLVALTGPDIDERPASYSTGSLGLCSTMDDVVLPTPSQLGDDAGIRFVQATLGVARCDESWLRSVFIGSGWSDAIWGQLAESLRSVPERSDQGWTFGAGKAATVSIDDDGTTAVTVQEGVFELHIIKSGSSIALAGNVGPESAAGLRAAVGASADVTNVWDFALAETGPELSDALRQAVEEMVGTGFRRSPAVEAFIAPGRVRVVSQDRLVTDGELAAPLFETAGIDVEATVQSAEPTTAERETVDALQAFAAGTDLSPAIDWADEIILGAGPNEGRRLAPGDMATRSNWLIENVPFFRAGGDEAFSALAVVPDPQMVAGPHNHCASPPVPAPASLAGLARVSVQPDADTIDSCLQWRTFDVFFDSGGRVAGVTVDWWEP